MGINLSRSRWLGVVGLLLPGGFVGEAYAQGANVCDRTVQVRSAIVAASGGTDCGEVTSRHLSDIIALDLHDQGIVTLDADDLDGLERLESLDLSDNLLTSLPEGVFDGLYLLRTLLLEGNLLETLPDDIFERLFLLEELTLKDNLFASLPFGLFDDFSRFNGIQANGDPADNSGSYSRIRRFLDRHDVTSPEEFIAALPPLFKERFAMMYLSEAPARDHVSAEHPRIISWGADGHFIFAWNTDPEAPLEFRESVEFLRQGEFSWTAGVVDFSGTIPEITEPDSCQTCHGSLNKPLWGRWNLWPGTEFSYESAAMVANMEANRTSTDPRIEPLDFSASTFPTGLGAVRFLKTPGRQPYVAAMEEAGAVWSLRHAEVLMRILRARHADFRQWGEDLVCAHSDVEAQFKPTVRSFDQEDHNLFLPANHELTIRDGLIAGISDLVGYNYYYHPAGSVGDAMIFLTIVDLWRKEPIVRHLYRKVSNADTIGRSGRHSRDGMLYYRSGSGTAEDELIQKLRIHFGQGGRTALSARARQNARIYLNGVLSASFWDGHAEVMRPRVCRALTRSAPGDVDVDLEDGSVNLEWSAPAFDAEDVTGYRILRARDEESLSVHVADTGSTDTTWSDENPPFGDQVYVVKTIYDGYYASPASREVRITVPKPPLTVAFEDLPASHDGSSSFTFRLRFSERIVISYETVRDRSVDVTNGTVKSASRVNQSSALWKIVVRPSGTADVTVSLEGGRACNAGAGGLCTRDGRRLSESVSAAVAGPGADGRQ